MRFSFSLAIAATLIVAGATVGCDSKPSNTDATATGAQAPPIPVEAKSAAQAQQQKEAADRTLHAPPMK